MEPNFDELAQIGMEFTLPRVNNRQATKEEIKHLRENINDDIKNTEEKMIKAIDNMEKRFTNVRAGRANPRILDPIMVKYYGVDTPLIQLATVSVPEARQLVIKPFDKSCISDIEKAIYEANIGLTPNNNGDVVTLVIPELTEDRRKEYVKEVKTISEEAKIALRNIRQDANNDIKKMELPVDDEKRGNERVQDLINKYNKIVDTLLSEKEKELMTV